MELRERLLEAREHRTAARQAFETIGGDDAAARAAATRQEALADMREVAERYTRVRVSTLLLQWAIDRYRRETQTPLLQRASQLFATLTGGSFASLRVDFDEHDRAHLIGVRPDSSTVHVPGMSAGTADQLYLALRVASVTDYLRRASALPFIADDSLLIASTWVFQNFQLPSRVPRYHSQRLLACELEIVRRHCLFIVCAMTQRIDQNTLNTNALFAS